MNGTKKIAAAVLVVVALASIVVFLRSGITIAQAIEYARGLRHFWWLPIAYFAAYAVLNVLFIPTQLLSVAAAVIWGWALGGTIELFAATLGAMLPFAIARWFVEDSRRRLSSITFSWLLAGRLVPVIPYTALNYAAALSPITPLQYVLATFFGIIPSTYIFAFFVDAIAKGVMQPREVFLRILLAGGLLAIFVVVTRLVGTRRHTAQTPDADGRSAE